MRIETDGLAAPELWAGVECTVARVGEAYVDQLELGGHAKRPQDLDLIAGLGVRALRYPVLWERTAPDDLDRADWSWPDERLARIRNLGIRPIVGLLHHGSGPRHTSLADPVFPEKLAAFAAAVAERYPWVEAYTPVNEPLTTARFSGLYGHWYPHGRDDRTFVRCLINQCRGVALSMQAVRAVNPGARLVQTEDLARIHATEAMAEQATFENNRRWLTFDLLCGRVDRDHPMTDYLRQSGATDHELAWFAEHPCPPDVLGLNHYLTSERFLDERLDRYPPHTHGGNGRQAYADVEAVRVLAEGRAGIRTLLLEVWDRYRLPLAITEVHLGCTREEQLRWFVEVWEEACRLRTEGVDVRAVTAWAVLGSVGWDCLATRPDGRYESGVFDLRAPSPRPTALASLVCTLAAGLEPDHPVLAVPGWWHRPGRLLYPPLGEAVVIRRPADLARVDRPVAILGATGPLGRTFVQHCQRRGLTYHELDRNDLDLTEPDAIEMVLDVMRPWAVVNATGSALVDAAERDPGADRLLGVDGSVHLAAACARRRVALLTVSSDQVFPGDGGLPYVEGDPVGPLNAFGRNKAEMEVRVLTAHPGALILRTAPLFGTRDESDFVSTALRTLASGRTLIADDESVFSPTYLPDFVDACLDLLIDGEQGLWHLVNAGALSWAELARRVARLAGFCPSKVEGRTGHSLGYAAPRPAFTVLSSERGMLLPTLDDALGRCLVDLTANHPDVARGSTPPTTDVELWPATRDHQVTMLPCRTHCESIEPLAATRTPPPDPSESESLSTGQRMVMPFGPVP